MGKYFLADIRYQGESAAGEFSLSEWQDNFYVDLQDSETVDIGIDRDLQQKTSRVRLYPRHSGQITLASIAFGGAIAKSSVITVKQSIRNGIDGTPVIQPIQQNYWSDQAIIIQVDVALHDPGNIVESNDLEAEGFILQTLSTQRIQSTGVDVMRLKWLLLTPNKGHYEIELPAIHQRGRGRFRYHLPILKLNIKPLPAYLPPTIPVGSLTVHSEIIKPESQSPGFLLTIQKSGRIPEHVEGLQTLFEGLGLDRLDVEIENRIDASTGRVSRSYQIPLPAWYFAQPNSIQIPYFDTTKGKLEYLQHQLPGIWLAPDYIKIIGGFIILLIIFYAGYRINNLAEKVRLWKRLQLQISQSNSAHQLRRLLLKTQPAKNL
ncbi:MAG: hypothetical protein KAU21_01710, partial [Gammaproteobacteria bacterium]|nr:hypothetical protein [Gammaproteobacteria bacterium]